MSMFDPDTRAKLAAFLAGEKNTQPYSETYQRGMFAPLGVNGYTGKAEPAIPSILGGGGWGTLHDIMQGRSVTKDEIDGAATELGGAAMTGGLAMPKGGVAKSIGRDPAMPPPPRVNSYPLEPGTGRPTIDARLYPEGVYPSEEAGLFDVMRRKGMRLEPGPAQPHRIPVADAVPSQPLSDLDMGKVGGMVDNGIAPPSSFDNAPQAYEYGGRYYLIDGHHRLRAAQMRGDEFLDAYIKRTRPRDEDRNSLVNSNPKEGMAANSLMQGAKNESQGIRAYHVSPHDFDKFDISKVGTGIGVTTEGSGLNFTTSKKLVDEYAKQMEEMGVRPHRYEVDLNLDKSKMLDWDSIEKGMPALAEILRTPQGRDHAIAAGKQGAIARNTGAGYEGTQNYTVFDDKLIEIARKYGIPLGALGLSAGGLFDTKNEQ